MQAELITSKNLTNDPYSVKTHTPAFFRHNETINYDNIKNGIVLHTFDWFNGYSLPNMNFVNDIKS